MDVLRGVWIVIVSFFVLPWRFLQDTSRMLGEIGRAGSFADTSGEQNPFLSWFAVAGKLAISISALLWLVGVIIAGIGQGVGGFVLSLIVGLVGAFVGIWLLALWRELVLLVFYIDRNTRKAAELLEQGAKPR
ncbi:MAG: hypothetical protein HYX89_07385 [Chloroflexi bacterium]|nr:hypothetical protein [Chloroflexota bacterium]